MSVRRVLREACATVQRAHACPDRGLAVDARGQKCEPLSPAAVAWTIVGALFLADPVRREPEARDTHGDHAWRAYMLLMEAARQQGYANTVEVDRAGQSAAVKCFWRAQQLAEPEGPARRQRGRASGARSTPTPPGDAA